MGPGPAPPTYRLAGHRYRAGEDPSFRLNYFRISEDEGRIVIDYERIQKAPPRELSLLQRLVARSPKRDALEDIPKMTVVDV